MKLSSSQGELRYECCSCVANWKDTNYFLLPIGWNSNATYSFVYLFIKCLSSFYCSCQVKLILYSRSDLPRCTIYVIWMATFFVSCGSWLLWSLQEIVGYNLGPVLVCTMIRSTRARTTEVQHRQTHNAAKSMYTASVTILIRVTVT